MLALLFIAQSATLFQAPHVQLGLRADGKPNQLSVVYQTTDDAPAYQVRYRQGTDWTTATQGPLRKIETTENPLHFVRTADFVGLKPGEAVEYEVLKDGTVLFKSSVVAPKSADQASRFIVFGDCAAGTPQQKLVAYQAAQQKPDLVVITGDIVYNNGRSSEYRSRFFPVYGASSTMRSVGSNLISTTLSVGAAGNHDTASFNTDKVSDGFAYFYYWNQPLNGPKLQPDMAKNVAKLTGANEETKSKFFSASAGRYPTATNFSFDYGNAHWVVLDSNLYADWTTAGLREWLIKDLDASKATWKFVAYHHPGFQSSKSHANDKQMRVLHDVFAQHGVDVVWQGHVHNYQRNFPMPASGKDLKDKDGMKANDWPLDREYDGVKVVKPKGVIYIVDGAGGAGLYNPELNDKPENWLPFTAKYFSVHSLSVVDLSGRTLKVSHKTPDGNTIDAWVIEK